MPAAETPINQVALEKPGEPHALEGFPDDQIPFSEEQVDARVQFRADGLVAHKRHVGGHARHGRRRSLSTNGNTDGWMEGSAVVAMVVVLVVALVVYNGDGKGGGGNGGSGRGKRGVV